jgi:hypothetical protein
VQQKQEIPCKTGKKNLAIVFSGLRAKAEKACLTTRGVHPLGETSFRFDSLLFAEKGSGRASTASDRSTPNAKGG